MKYSLIIYCIILCISVGCTRPSEGKNPRGTASDGLEINVICKFVKDNPDKKAFPTLVILCVSKVPIHADIGYQVGSSTWIPIVTGLKAVQRKNKYIVGYRWENPNISEHTVMIKVTAVSSDGKKRTVTKAVDCVQPASKATFYPFSL
ncbi:hypothetical protein ACFL6F_00135 [Planctomycetota bacterium]